METNQRRFLIAGGFTRRGECLPGNSAATMLIEGLSERTAGVYAFVVGNKVVYIGAAQRGLHERLKHYETTTGLKTAARVRGEIQQVLKTGRKVEVLTFMPKPSEITRQKLPVDLVSGLETGLIRHLKPEWNKRGVRRAASQGIIES